MSDRVRELRRQASALRSKMKSRLNRIATLESERRTIGDRLRHVEFEIDRLAEQPRRPS